MAESVGELFVRIRPAPGSQAAFETEAAGGMKSAGMSLGKVFGAAFALGAAGLAVKSIASAATNSQAAFAVLETTVKNAGASNELYGKSIESVLKSQSRLKGFSDTELASAFVRLVSATKNSEQAYKDLGLAEDVARARHIGVEQAALAVSKAEQGSATALQRLGIVVPQVTAAVDAVKAKREAAVIAGAKFTESEKAQWAAAILTAQAQDKQATRLQALNVIQERFGGSAATFANTSAGQFARLAQDLEQFKEALGTSALPVLATGAEDAGKALQFLSDHLGGAKQTFEIFLGVFAVSKLVSLGRAITANLVTAGIATIGPAAATAATEVETANAAEALSFEGVAAASTVAATTIEADAVAEGASVSRASLAVTGLASKLSGLGLLAIAPIVIPIEYHIFKDAFKGDNGGGGVGGFLKGVAIKTLDFGPAVAGAVYRAIEGTGKDSKIKAAATDAGKSTGEAFKSGAAEALKDMFANVSKFANKAAKEAAQELADHNAYLASINPLKQTIAQDQTDLANLQTQATDAATQGAQALATAIDSAKQNLDSIGQSIASSLSTFIDKPLNDAAKKISDAQAKLSLFSDKQSLADLGKEVLLPGGKKLSTDPDAALKQLMALRETSHGSPGLDAFIRQYESAALQVKSDQVTIKQNAASLRETAASRRISDLTGQYDLGKISAPTLERDITAILTKNGLTPAAAQRVGGSAFAQTLRGQEIAFHQQALAIQAVPGGIGKILIPSITRPLDTLNATQKQLAGLASQERAKQLHEAKTQTELLKKIHTYQTAQTATDSLSRNPGTATKKGQKLVDTEH